MRDYKHMVKHLVKKFETRDPHAIAKELGITIKFQQLSCRSPKGIFKKVLKKKFIIINTTRITSKSDFNMVLAHELGHATLHSSNCAFFLHEHTFSNRGRFEIEANHFAAELLINNSDLDDTTITGYSQEQLACYYSVPVELIRLKFENL